MKWLAWILVALALSVIGAFVIVLIGRFTIGYERIYYWIGIFATAEVYQRCARWIIDKTTDKNERI